MTKLQLPFGALEIVMKEYESLRAEISERLKTAFSHVAYIGAIVAFAVPLAIKPHVLWIKIVLLILAGIGVLGLGWVALLNMRWVQHCGRYKEHLEARVNAHFGEDVLGWERYASSVQSKVWFLIPKTLSTSDVGISPSRPLSPKSESST